MIPPAMPVTFASLFRGLVLLALAVHVFYMYSLARAMQGVVGTDVAAMTVAALFAFAMLIPLVWAVTLPELPEIYTRHVRGRRWFNAGRCPACGYQASATADPSCSECGAALKHPEPYALNMRTVRTFVLINVLAWGLGSVAGEIWAIDDERQFAREAEARIESGHLGDYIRPRRWPVDSQSLKYEPGAGVTSL